MALDTPFYSLGLIGYPLEHSLSPRLHGAALSAMGLDGEYRLYLIPPLPEGERALAGLLARLRRGELNGLNVTIPHKQNVMHYLDKLSPAARAIGAVNTIWMQDDKLSGDNTDSPGFMADLERIAYYVLCREQFGVDNADRHALVLGAGGSARAVVYALLEAGWRVTVAARRLEQAWELAESFQLSLNSEQWSVDGDRRSVFGGRLSAIELVQASIYNLISKIKITLVVNATPLGMWPNVQTIPWPQSLDFPEKALVYDLVYNPPETALVRSARAAGLAAASGLGMLVEQAALALERWTASLTPRQPMWESVLEFQDRSSAWGAASQLVD